jgi:hypothetical protein
MIALSQFEVENYNYAIYSAFERETIFQRQKDGERATDAKRQALAASRAAHGALASSGNYMVGHDGIPRSTRVLLGILDGQRA